MVIYNLENIKSLRFERDPSLMQYIYISLCRHKQRKSGHLLLAYAINALRAYVTRRAACYIRNRYIRNRTAEFWPCNGAQTVNGPHIQSDIRFGDDPIYLNFVETFLKRSLMSKFARNRRKIASRVFAKLIETRAKVKLVHLSPRVKQFEGETIRG